MRKIIFAIALSLCVGSFASNHAIGARVEAPAKVVGKTQSTAPGKKIAYSTKECIYFASVLADAFHQDPHSAYIWCRSGMPIFY